MISVQAYSLFAGSDQGLSSDVVRFSIRSGALQADDAGNTTGTARMVTVGETAAVFNDFVGDADLGDYYRIDLASPGNLVLSLTNLGGNADLHLLDSGEATLATSMHLDARGEFVSENLAAGTYYARIVPVGGDDTSYKFTALLA
jgi:hypothetical protein